MGIKRVTSPSAVTVELIMATTTTFIVLCGALLVNGAFIRRPHLDGRIVGGTDGNIEDHPYQVSLRSDGFSLCSATIIGEDWVLTAAHCVYSASIGSMKLRAGTSKLNVGGSLHQVERMIIHEKHVRNGNDYDFALLKIEPSFTFGKKVQAIAMVRTEPTAGEPAVISGWGQFSSAPGRYSEHIQVATVPIFDHARCKFYYSDYTEVTPRMICAGLDKGGKDTCVGDDGGPLVVGGKLAGIVSWGAACGEPDYPSVYANIANQREWIKEKTSI